MTRKKCRVCNNVFFATPLLTQVNMPRSAQYLPGEKELAGDRGVDLKICQCSGCGLVQLANEPVRYYKEVIRSGAFSEEIKEFRRRQIARIIRTHGLTGKKMIEIGCGAGDFLAVLREFDVDCRGLEYSKESVARCKKIGLNVSRGYIENRNDRLSGAPFDFFFILNFLEHIPDPTAAVRGIYANLTDCGMGLVEVPNFDMILRKNLFSEFIPDHLFYFTRQTLAGLLTMNGFETIECNEERDGYVISAVVRKRNKSDVSEFKNSQGRLEEDINAFIARFGPRNVAVWGAGHQALALISLLHLSDKINYVIDSATFKQNKFTPASHVKIVPPDALVSERVEAVIVMAAAYSDEVARIVRQRYDKNIKLAVVRDFGLEILG